MAMLRAQHRTKKTASGRSLASVRPPKDVHFRWCATKRRLRTLASRLQLVSIPRSLRRPLIVQAGMTMDGGDYSQHARCDAIEPHVAALLLHVLQELAHGEACGNSPTTATGDARLPSVTVEFVTCATCASRCRHPTTLRYTPLTALTLT